MSTFLKEAAEARLQGIVDELHGLGMTVSIENGKAAVLMPELAPMKLLPPPAAAAAAFAGAGGASTTPPRKEKLSASGRPKCCVKCGKPCKRLRITSNMCRVCDPLKKA